MAKERPYTCADCPEGTQHVTTGAGPLPERCPPCREKRIKQQDRDRSLSKKRDRRKGRLHVVAEGQEAPQEPRQPLAAPLDSAEGTEPPSSVLKALRGDLEGLFSEHPAAATLTSVAEVLADVLDSPLVQADGRIAAAVSKELRGVVHELTSAKAPEEDDLFSGSAGPSVASG